MADSPALVAYAATLEIDAFAAVKGEDWQKGLVNFFDNLARLCLEQKVQAIGHIKGFLQLADEAGSCYFSTTGSVKGTSVKGQLDGETSHGKLDFNILVYGLEKATVTRIATEAIQLLEQDLKANCSRRSSVNPAKTVRV